MKHYYIHFPNNFRNQYALFSVEAGSEQEQELKRRGFERITRKEAEAECRAEKARRKDDPYFSGYAPTKIESYDTIRGPWINCNERNETK